MSPVFHQFPYEDVIGDSTESLNTVEINNIHCSPLLNKAHQLITEGY